MVILLTSGSTTQPQSGANAVLTTPPGGVIGVPATVPVTLSTGATPGYQPTVIAGTGSTQPPVLIAPPAGGFTTPVPGTQGDAGSQAVNQVVGTYPGEQTDISSGSCATCAEVTSWFATNPLIGVGLIVILFVVVLALVL